MRVFRHSLQPPCKIRLYNQRCKLKIRVSDDIVYVKPDETFECPIRYVGDRDTWLMH